MAGAGDSSRAQLIPSLWLRALHLAALSAIAISQPLYDLLGRNPIFFIAKRMSWSETVVLTVGLAAVVPLGLLLAELVIGLASPKLGWWLHLLFLFGLAVLVALPLTRRFGMGAKATLLTALVAAAILAWIYSSAQPAKTFLSFLSPAWAIFPILFLWTTPVLRSISETKAPPTPQPPRLAGPVVLVVFDELPLISLLDGNHRIDAGRYPNFAKLASQATWYPNAVTVAGSTTYSVTSILTGRRPKPETLPILADHPENLFTWFGGSPPIVALESATRLCPTNYQLPSRPWRRDSRTRWEGLVRDLVVVYQHLTLPGEWTAKLPTIGDNWGNFAMRREQAAAYNSRPALFSSFVGEIQPGVDGLYFVHVFLPHLPWSRLPDGKAYTERPWQVAGLDLKHEYWSQDPWLLAQGYRRHLLQVELVDGLLGELCDRLRSTGLFDSSLIVVTADHGCNFRLGRHRRALLPDTPLDVLNVPLLIKSPGQVEAELDSASMRTIDILPTVAEILGAEPPWAMDGHAVPAEGPRPTWPPEDWSGQESLDRKIALFGEGRRELPRPQVLKQLVGLPDGEIAPEPDGDLEIVVSNRDAFRDVDLDSAFIPLMVEGRARGLHLGGESITLAISVNGVVRAVTHSRRKVGPWFLFSAMLSRTDLREGSNEIRVSVVDAPNESSQWTPATRRHEAPVTGSARGGSK